jgi:drug/metabolite transporter (DMT)-like permease
MTRLGISEIPPLFLATLRLGLATIIFMGALIVLPRHLPRESRTLADIAIVGVTSTAVPLVAFTVSLQFISSAVLTIFIALIPVFTAVMAHLWLPQERLTLIKVAGLSSASGGVAILLITGTSGLVESAAGLDMRGPLLALGGALVAAASGVYTRLRLRDVDAFVVTAGQTAVAMLAVAPLAWMLSAVELSAITWRGWLAVFYTGIIGSFFAFLVYFHMIRRFGATTAALPTYVMPATSAALGVLILGEIITLPLVAGAGLILSGVFLASR